MYFIIFSNHFLNVGTLRIPAYIILCSYDCELIIASYTVHGAMSMCVC